MCVEASCGRFAIALPYMSDGCDARRNRVLSSCYQERISLLAIKMSFRSAVSVFNTMTERKGTDDELPLSTFCDDIEYVGTRLITYKESLAQRILAAHNFNPETGLYLNNELPEEYKTARHKTITVNPSDIMGCSNETLSKMYYDTDNGCGPEQFSKPDMETYPIEKARRGLRKNLPPDQVEEVCRKYILHNNTKVRGKDKWILRPFELETDSSEILYVSIDAVLVPEQCESRVRGGKTHLKDKKTFISHWNIRLELDNTHYSVTAANKDEAYRETIAVILKNGLYCRYIVFFTDGEKCIFEDIDTYFSFWDHTVYLDWFHLQEKVFNLMTMIIKADRVIDPHGKTEYYKTGTRKGEIKSQEKISLSRLYARELCLILWYGNTTEALSYLAHLNPDVIKSQHWLDELISYLSNKKRWITCYALRKKAGLRNSSNGVENQNMVTVSNRQKKKGMSWREKGSAVLASLTALFDNQEATDWFYNHQLSFKINSIGNT